MAEAAVMIEGLYLLLKRYRNPRLRYQGIEFLAAINSAGFRLQQVPRSELCHTESWRFPYRSGRR